MVTFFGTCFSCCTANPEISGLDSIDSLEPLTEKERLFNGLVGYLSKSSQAVNEQSIRELLSKLRDFGICQLEGNDQDIRPGAVGLQCLLEEFFVDSYEVFEKADFEVHTTMPSTPCCKLPDERALETFLAVFQDEERLATIDGRSASLYAITLIPNSSLHVTFTKAGLLLRKEQERSVFENYWAPRVNSHCVDAIDQLPEEVNGATYRLRTLSGKEIFFGIRATQANDANGRSFILCFGTKDQPEVKNWLEEQQHCLEALGRILFAN